MNIRLLHGYHKHLFGHISKNLLQVKYIHWCRNFVDSSHVSSQGRQLLAVGNPMAGERLLISDSFKV